MNKIFNLILFTAIILLNTQAQAIEWVKADTVNGKTAYVDKDSIIKKDKSYFYNIKYKNKPSDEFQILTIQSAIHNSYSARLKLYSESEYEALKGDYDNIMKNSSPKLELAIYGSVVHSCHNKVKEIAHEKEIPAITVE